MDWSVYRIQAHFTQLDPQKWKAELELVPDQHKLRIRQHCETVWAIRKYHKRVAKERLETRQR